MSDEQKVEEKKCDCKCKELLLKFLLKVCAVFLGTLLAILVASSLLRPPVPPCACPCKMMKHHPGMERQIPPMGMHKKHFNGQNFQKRELPPRADFNKVQNPGQK